MVRKDGRTPDQLRPVTITPGWQETAFASALVELGRTKVVCAVSYEDRVPPFLRGSGTGWVTSEYAMLPGATSERSGREVAKGRPGGRTHEIQRLIGRSLRAVTDTKAFGESTLWSTATSSRPTAAPAAPPSPAPGWPCSRPATG
jgi:ribonuclease PH